MKRMNYQESDRKSFRSSVQEEAVNEFVLNFIACVPSAVGNFRKSPYAQSSESHALPQHHGLEDVQDIDSAARRR